MPTLRQVTLVDMPQVTDRVVAKAISITATDESRRLSLTLSDEQMSRRVRRRHLKYPPNLTVNFDAHLCGKQLADTEPTDVQMILVIIMSAIILGMTLLTTVVVILVPLSMLLMMAHEWVADLIFADSVGGVSGDNASANNLFDWLASAVTPLLEEVIAWTLAIMSSSSASSKQITSVDDIASGGTTSLFSAAGSFFRKLIFGVLVSSK